MKRFLVKISDCGCEYRELIDLDTKETVMSGDYYHDKIQESIDGFLLGVAYVTEIEEEEERSSCCPYC